MRKVKTAYSKGSVLITGGAKRLGRAIAIYLANLGYPIAIHYNRSRKEAENLANEICQSKGRCEIFAADLKDPKAAAKLLPDVHQKFPDLCFLVNNASIFVPSKIKSANLKDFDDEFAINLRAPFILTSQFAKIIQKGSIVNIVDTNVSKNQTAHFSYLLTKKSLADLTRLAAVELSPYIRVNAVAPGLILAPVQKNSNYLNRLAKNIPLKHKGDPEDIAKAVHFLLENTFITGQTIFVDGGEHLL